MAVDDKYGEDIIGHPQDWGEDPAELDVSLSGEDGGERSPSIVVQHPTAPFFTPLDSLEEEAIQERATLYLERALSALASSKITEGVLDPLKDWQEELARPKASPSERFGWATLRGDDEGFSSFFVNHVDVRNDRGDDSPEDLTLVLLAGERLGERLRGSEFGIRVIIQVGLGPNGEKGLRFTGFAAALPFGRYATHPVTDASRFEIDRLGTLRGPLARRLDLDEETTFFRGFRLAEVDAGLQVEVSGRGMAAPAKDGKATGSRAPRRPYAFIADVLIPKDADTPVLRSAHREALIANAAAGQAHVFKRDPASQRPVRDADGNLTMRRPTRDDPEPVPGGLNPSPSPGDLNQYREPERIPPILSEPSPPGPPDQRLFAVRTSEFIHAERGADSIRTVSLPSSPAGTRPRLRSHDFSAISAYWNVKDVFDRFADYNIVPFDYFRAARLPLEVHYRSGVEPGPGKDGITVNARVLPKDWPPRDFGPRCDNPLLELHFGMASLSHRERQPWNGRDRSRADFGVRSQAEYMGIGADPRWIWHEFGHVLLMATTGALEMRFAHSPGDALAAIASDPDSELATDLDYPRARGATFPWVFVNRRHDRNVLRGWSWSGSQHRGVRNNPDGARIRHKGYGSEQILSTSLFRMYRCLGGDTATDGNDDQPDRDARRFASDYALFLIMRALEHLHNECLVPANSVESFVESLISVDVVTESFTIGRPGGGPARTRVGGCAHKVIRWAFEAQGLYPDPNDDRMNINEPGVAMPVDIYIPDRRPSEEVLPDGSVPLGAGSYVPVSLHWPDRAAGFPAAWTSGDEGIRLVGDRVHVTVGNRGSGDDSDGEATNVAVQLWWRDYDDGDLQPSWNDGNWTPDLSGTIASIPAGATRTLDLGSFTPAAAGSHVLVFVGATCRQDRANIEPSTALPCSREETPIIDLVSGDNNLGLALLPVL